MSHKKIDWRDYILYIGFVVIIAAFSIILSDKGFLTWSNFMSILRQTAAVSVMAVGMTFSISAGITDMSIGSIVSLSALTAALILKANDSFFLAVAGSICVGLLCGLINGFFIAKVGIPPFLVTLGTENIFIGISRQLCNLQAIPITNDRFNFIFGAGNIGPVSTLFIWTIVIMVIGDIVYRKTTFGRRVLATGGNEAAAKYSGVRTSHIKMEMLLITGFVGALAGLLYDGRMNGARYTFGENDCMSVVTAVVIGGTSYSGGEGNVIGSIIGSIVVGAINNGLLIMGLSTSEQLIARGIIIILAVALSSNKQAKSE